MSDLSVYASSFISLYSRNVWYLLSPLHDVRRQRTSRQSADSVIVLQVFFISLFSFFIKLTFFLIRNLRFYSSSRFSSCFQTWDTCAKWNSPSSWVHFPTCWSFIHYTVHIRFRHDYFLAGFVQGIKKAKWGSGTLAASVHSAWSSCLLITVNCSVKI